MLRILLYLRKSANKPKILPKVTVNLINFASPVYYSCPIVQFVKISLQIVLSNTWNTVVLLFASMYFGVGEGHKKRNEQMDLSPPPPIPFCLQTISEASIVCYVCERVDIVSLSEYGSSAVGFPPSWG
jgi:hypothetical protein